MAFTLRVGAQESVEFYASDFSGSENTALHEFDGWSTSDTQSTGIVDFEGDIGRKAYVGYVLPAGQTQVWAGHTVNGASPDAGRPVLSVSLNLAIIDSSNSQYDYFDLELFNGNGRRLASLNFSNYDLHVYAYSQASGSFVDTGATFENGQFYQVELLFDPAIDVWSAFIDGVPIWVDQPLVGTSEVVASPEAFYATWYPRDTESPGDNFLIFDEVSMKTQVRQTVPVFTATSPTVEVPPGFSPRLAVEATGGLLSYQWYQGESGDTSAPIAEATAAVFYTPAIVEPASFWVRVSNAAGTSDSETFALAPTTEPGLVLLGIGRNDPISFGGGDQQSYDQPVVISTGLAKVEAGMSHSLFLGTDGTLWAVGGNDYGQFGDGTTTKRDIPIQIANDVSSMAAGSNHSLFVKTDGTLWAMGYNEFGQLGDGTQQDRNVPVQVADDVVAVTTNVYHNLILKSDGSLWAVGFNSLGQLGDGTSTNRSIPVQIATDVASMAACYQHSVFVKTDGTLWGMGQNEYYQLGDGTTTSQTTPVQIATGVAMADVGDRHTMFLKHDGTLWGMGTNEFGELGDGTTTPRPTPVQLASEVSFVDSGIYHTLFVKTDGTLWATGYNDYGQLGVGDSQGRNAFVPVTSISGVQAISAGYEHTLMLQYLAITTQPSDQFVAIGQGTTLTVSTVGTEPDALHYQWYRGESGDISDPVIGAVGSTLDTGPLAFTTSYWVRVTHPQAVVDSPAANLTTVSTPMITAQPEATEVLPGFAATLVVNATGEALSYQWYARVSGDVSAPVEGATTAHFATPAVTNPVSYWVRVSNIAGEVASVDVQVTSQATQGFRLEGAGGVTVVQPGDDTFTNQLSPVHIADGIIGASPGRGHGLMIDGANRLWASGFNDHGQLGDGTNTTRLTPVKVAEGVVKAEASDGFSYFMTLDGTLWAMGENNNGQLGDGTAVARNLPVPVASDVLSIASGADHGLFIKTDGTLWGMGYNYYGQLGTSTSWRLQSPIQIASDVVSAAAGDTHTLFIKADGTLWGMGENNFGQLGDGTQTDRHEPVQIATDVVSADAGHHFSMFITSDGRLWGMGYNYLHQLGDGSTSTRITPVQIATEVAAVSVNADTTVFLKTDGTFWAIGSNYSGQFGNGTTEDASTPLLVATGLSQVVTGFGQTWRFRPLAPDIAAQPENASTVVGNRVILSVEATGSALSYQWHRNGEIIAGATAPSLVIEEVSLSDDADYTVMISNELDTVTSAPAHLTVQAPPVIETQPIAQTVVTGNSATLSVTANGVPAPSYQWRRNGEAIVGATAASLVIESVSLNDDADYDVMVSNAVSTITSETVHLTVHTPPAIETQPLGQTVAIGENVTLTVVASGVPAPEYQWRHDGEPISGATDSSYTIASAMAEDAGSYDVVVSNPKGSVTSDATTLVVIEAPVITQHPQSQAGFVGQSYTFTVTAEGPAPLAYQWFKDDGAIAGATSTSFTVSSTSLADAGNYRVEVANSAGSVSSEAATLSLLSLSTSHEVRGYGYRAGGTVMIDNTITYAGPLSGFAWSVIPPSNLDQSWTFAGDSNEEGTVVSPRPGDTDLLEWRWTIAPASPFTFSYSLQVPEDATGVQSLIALATLSLADNVLDQVAIPDPLLLPEAPATHSADVNDDFLLSLSELLRVIELYNYRSGTTRTGEYHPDPSTEDGFAPAPRESVPEQLHSADTDRDGALSLSELLRVIELYNHREGTQRTGAYHPSPSTADGFAVGPSS